jgi:uncharacterized damage-inducible protein DinB
MREVERIAQQLRQAFAGPAWHGPSVLEVLREVDADTAADKPIPGAHSIWELVLHLAATQDVMLRRLRGEPAGKVEEEFWPPAPEPAAEAWQSLLERLQRQEEVLTAAVVAFPDDRLGELLTPEGSSAYNNFHGHAQHNTYHAGQIALLKKAASGRTARRT